VALDRSCFEIVTVLSPTVFYDIAANLLAAIVTYYNANGLALPETQYVAMPPVVPYCDSLVVVAGPVYVATPGATGSVEPMMVSTRRAGDLEVYLYRCAPSLEGEGEELLILDVDALDDYARTVMTDQVALHRAVSQGHGAGLFQNYSKKMMLGPVTPLPIQGGLGGCSMAVTVEVMSVTP
jgi:hypothetical protein